MSRPLIFDRARESARLAEGDGRLLERIVAGDADAFATLLRELWRPLVSYCARIVEVRESAEDVAQEAFIRFWENRTRWQSDSSARALLYTIARNLALNERKASEARIRRVGKAGPTYATTPLPDQRVEADEFSEALQRAIGELPMRKREVLMLSRFDGLSRAEIAAVTGLSEQTVANYLVAALTALRATLGPFLADGD